MGTLMSSCTGLTSVTIPSSVTSIKSNAFDNCTALTSVIIPSSVSYIGSLIFSDCVSLSSISTNRIIPVDLSSSPSVFNNVNKTTCTLHVPVGSKTLYQAADQWKDFTSIVEDIPAAVNNTTAGTLKVNIQNGQAVISGIPVGEAVTVYNQQGTAIYNQPANSGTVAVSLPAHGVYVVRVGLESVKVVY